MKNARLLIFTLAIGTFSILNTEVGVIGILPIIAQTFHVSVPQAGLLVSLFALVVAISGPITPVIFSRFERKRVLLSVLAIFVISNLVAAFAPNFTIVMIARLIPAAVHPIYTSLAFTIAGEAVPPMESSKAVSRVMIGVSAGMVLGTPITTMIASSFSYTAAMLFFAVVSAGALIINWMLLPKMPQPKRTKATSTATTSDSHSSLLLAPKLWISGLGTVLIGSALFIVYGYISDFLGTVSHFSSQQLSIALFLFGLASIVGNIVAGHLLTNRPQWLIGLYPWALLLVYVVLLLLAHTTGLLFALILIWGMVYGIGNNVQQYLVSAALPTAPDLANGLFLSLGNVGTTLGTLLGGSLLASLGSFFLPIAGICVLVVTAGVTYWRNQKMNSGHESIVTE